jgi:NAD(P)-dependent dehydrogenase (short-subunit alcohol dehydrogenase family)
MGRLDGKTAIITGGAGGIGIAAASRFIAEGASVMLVDLQDAPLAEAARSLGPKAAHFAVDVTQDESAHAYVDATVQKFGRVDVALLNAGIEGTIGRLTDLPQSNFDRVMAVNVRAVWLGLAALMPVMKRDGGGSIVITSSTSGLRASPGLAAYATSKHAVIGMMRAAALEGATDNIRINTVNPAPIDTRMMTAIEQGRSPNNPEGARESARNSIPMKRYGDPAEVANLMLFLASNESSFCTGGVYQVDGGVMAGAVR